MPSTLNRNAWRQLLAEDIAWLESRVGDSLEGRHILDILRMLQHCSPAAVEKLSESEKPMKRDLTVLVRGNAGTGKTTLCEKLAEFLRTEFPQATITISNPDGDKPDAKKLEQMTDSMRRDADALQISIAEQHTPFTRT